MGGDGSKSEGGETGLVAPHGARGGGAGAGAGAGASKGSTKARTLWGVLVVSLWFGSTLVLISMNKVPVPDSQTLNSKPQTLNFEPCSSTLTPQPQSPNPKR